MNKKVLKYILFFVLGWFFCSVQCLLVSIFSSDRAFCKKIEVFPFEISIVFEQDEYSESNEIEYSIFNFCIMKTYSKNHLSPKLDGFPDSFNE